MYINRRILRFFENEKFTLVGESNKVDYIFYLVLL